MGNLIKVGETINAKGVMTSLELVEQINLFRDKEGNRATLAHSDLLKIIRDEFEEEIGVGNISESSYFNSQNKKQPMFKLTLSQAKQVLVRESRFVRKAVILYIEKIEDLLRNQQPKLPTTYKEALQQLLVQVEENEKLQLENKAMLPKAEFFDAVADSKTAIPMNDVAKVLDVKGYGRNNLFEFLRNKKILMQNNRPFQSFIDRGYFRVIEQRYQKNNEECINFKTLVYQKGVDFIRKTINDNKK